MSDLLLKEIIKDKLKEVPDFRVGDTVRVKTKIIEGEKERTHVFEGIVIRKRGSGISSTFTVRKISYKVGVERIFPLHSPLIEKIEVIRRGKVRRARLYYLRLKKGEDAQVKQRVPKKEMEKRTENAK